MPAGGQVHIGTSGWHYKHWIGDFYPPKLRADKMFLWYAREFQTVEINNSFYRLPEEKTFQQWKAMAPRGFVFAVKASRFLTHIKRLRDPEDPIKLFFSRAQKLGSHLGPVLFQLPPKWKSNPERLQNFLAALPRGRRYAIEFRDESWLRKEIYELLRRHNVAMCIHDWHDMPWPVELTADFIYMRFHGTTGRYGGSYPDPILRRWAEKIRDWQERLAELFVYFNNDIGGHAIRNAQSLRLLLDSESFREKADHENNTEQAA